MDWNEVWRAAPPIIQAVSVAVAAYFAVRSLNAWRDQTIGRRKFEVAEEIIVAAFKAQDALEWIRSPLGWSGEAKDRPKIPGETEGEARQRETYYIPIARIKERSEEFAELARVLHLARAHFPDAVRSIQELFNIRREINVDAQMLGEMVGEEITDNDTKELRIKMRRTIWGTGGKQDEIAPRIQNAIEMVDEVCGPSMK